MLEHVKAQQLFADRYIFSQLHFYPKSVVRACCIMIAFAITGNRNKRI